MTRREWVAAAWAEWAPSCRAGRLDIGRFVIVSRTELSRWAQEHAAIGANMQRNDPATAPRLAALIERDGQEAEPVAAVRHLHAVQG